MILRTLLAVFLLLSTLTACNEKETEKITLAHFGQAKFLLYLPLYVAMEDGHFAEQGIDVDIKFAGNDNNSFSALLSGEADFSIGDPVFAAIAREKGSEGKVVAMLITSLGLGGVTNNPDIPEITDVKQLDGLRVSSFAEPSTTFTLLNEIKREHNLSGMKIVQAPFGAQIATVASGRADIATDIEPSVSIAESEGYRRVLSLGDFTDRQAITGITTLDSTIENNPEMVQGFVTALQNAVTKMYENPQISYEVAEKLYPDLSPEVVKKAVDVMLAEKLYPESVKVDDALWRRTLKTRLDSGELQETQETSVSVDNSFAENALKD